MRSTLLRRSPYRPYTVKPAMSGGLVTRGSADNASIVNYTIKRDIRRDLDVEKRREGFDYFYPNTSLPVGGQPFPGQLTIDKLSSSGAVVTATRSQGHWFQNGEKVRISGATNPAYNGTFTVSNVTATTFQYNLTSSYPDDVTPGITATPEEKINLIDCFERPNGQLAVVAGSPRRLYRYVALDDPDFISRDPSFYPPGTPTDQLLYWSVDPTLYPTGAPEYVDSNPGYWIVIGAGFDPNGKRWETEDINGWMVFNNSKDLPVTYRVEDAYTVPIYELRDNGIASVGTISELDGILMCGDITEIKSDALVTWMRDNNRTTISSLTFASGIATATAPGGHSFQPRQMVTIHETSHLEYSGTVEVLSATATTFTYRVNGSPPSPDGSGGIYATGDPYQQYTDENTTDRTQYRLIWGTPDFPRRWAAIVPGFMTAGSNELLLQYPAKGFEVGMNVTVTGAGPSHAGGTADNLDAKIIFVNDRTLILDKFASTNVSMAPVQATDSIGSIVGYEDLQDDGRGIIKMMPLVDQMVIYKASAIYLAQYQGNPDMPFAFAIREVQRTQAIFYRNTLTLVKTSTEMFHIYAGQNSFLRFDLTGQQPLIMPRFESCSDIFFKQANLDNTEDIFACGNDLTNEIWWVRPTDPLLPYSQDKAICWDYKQDTHSTTALVITAGATITKPVAGKLMGPEQDWFVTGNSACTIMQYGLATVPQSYWNNAKEIYYQRGAYPYNATKNPYPSVMRWGLGSFGTDYIEKDLRALVVLMDSKAPDTPFTLSLYSAHNANRTPYLEGSMPMPDPILQNLMPCMFRELYFTAQIDIAGLDNPWGFVGLVWDFTAVDSRSATRG